MLPLNITVPLYSNRPHTHKLHLHTNVRPTDSLVTDSIDLLQEMLGELFTPTETPEAQNRGFLKGFFGGNAQTFDREELCECTSYSPVCLCDFTCE